MYDTLVVLSRKATLLSGIGGLLGWDQETYMPPAAGQIRGSQLELLASLSHSIRTSPEYEAALNGCSSLPLEPAQKAAVARWRHDFERAKKLPTSFVEAWAKLTSEAIIVWQEAKSHNNFALFEGHLQRIVDMARQKAELIGYTTTPYDALLDEYEPDITTATIRTLFDQLKGALIPLLQSVPRSKAPPLLVPLSNGEQLTLCKNVLQCIEYDPACGRLDLSAHPFCSSYHPTDCRITTRLESHGLVTQILTVLHEAGHAFYEMGLPAEHFGTPLCEAVSMGIHESQSRFWETRIGRGLPFWQFFYPLITQLFPGKIDHIPVEELLAQINRVEPTFIRTDADEVTYPLHVILRFEIEQELLNGTLRAHDLPARWDSGMKELLGITPPTATLGCLQDIHWSMGGFGYFPTYTLGNIYAAQLFDAFTRAYPDWADRVRSGSFGFIREWLHTNIHRHGRRYTSQELIQQITGGPIAVEPYIAYLTDKVTVHVVPW